MFLLIAGRHQALDLDLPSEVPHQWTSTWSKCYRVERGPLSSEAFEWEEELWAGGLYRDLYRVFISSGCLYCRLNPIHPHSESRPATWPFEKDSCRCNLLGNLEMRLTFPICRTLSIVSWVSMQGKEDQRRNSQVRRGINESSELEESGDPPRCPLLEEAQQHLFSSSRSEKKTYLLYFKLTSFVPFALGSCRETPAGRHRCRQTETQDGCQSPQHLNLLCLHLSQHPWLPEADIFIF